MKRELSQPRHLRWAWFQMPKRVGEILGEMDIVKWVHEKTKDSEGKLRKRNFDAYFDFIREKGELPTWWEMFEYRRSL